MKNFEQNMSMKVKLGLLVFLSILVTLPVTGCATYSIDTPPELIELEDHRRRYSAMSHDGVVLRARILRQGNRAGQIPRGDHDFWVNAIGERMRTTGGYALLETREVRSADGHRGTRLEFGRDQDRAPYHYWVVLFVTEKNIHVIDAGGRQERFEAIQGAVESAISSYEVRR